jgi:hypothetical protein
MAALAEGTTLTLSSPDTASAEAAIAGTFRIAMFLLPALPLVASSVAPGALTAAGPAAAPSVAIRPTQIMALHDTERIAGPLPTTVLLRGGGHEPTGTGRGDGPRQTFMLFAEWAEAQLRDSEGCAKRSRVGSLRGSCS